MVADLSVDDEIVTAGGLYGTVQRDGRDDVLIGRDRAGNHRSHRARSGRGVNDEAPNQEKHAAEAPTAPDAR